MKRALFGLLGLLVGLTVTGVDTIAPKEVQALTANELRQQARDITVLIDGLNPGSGVIVAREPQNDRYWVLTARHVVATDNEYWIMTPDGQEHAVDYQTVQKLPNEDLALIAFESPNHYAIAPLAEYPQSDAFPYLVVSGWTGSNIHQTPVNHSLTAGQLLRRRYGLLYSQTPFTHGYDLFYTSITELGMSGGPILDTDGRVIGIHGRSEGEARYIETAGETVRLHWGFSSGIPLPPLETLKALPPVSSRQLSQWNWQPTPPQSPTSQDIASLQALLNTPSPQTRNPVDWTNHGNRLYRLEYFEQAIAAFEQAIALEPEFYPAWYGMGQTLTTRGEYEAALQSYSQVQSLNPSFYQVLRDRALTYVLMGDYQKAIDDFDQLILKNPDDYVAWYLRGNLFWRHLDWNDAALGSYDRALTIAPQFAEVWIERGRVLQKMGHSSDAIASLNRSVQLEPDLAMGWFWLAKVSFEMNDAPTALNAIQEVLRIDPNDVAGLWLHSQILVSSGNTTQARATLQHILSLDPNHQDAQSLLSRL